MNENNKLKIRKSSWLYKLHEKCWGPSCPTNLCEYVNGLFIAFILGLCIIVTAPICYPVLWISRAIGFVYKASANNTAVLPVLNKFDIMKSYMKLPMAILAGGSWFTFVLFIVAHTRVTVADGLGMIFLFGVVFGIMLTGCVILGSDFYGPGRNNDLFWEWVLAKKRKICPLVEVVDE